MGKLKEADRYGMVSDTLFGLFGFAACAFFIVVLVLRWGETPLFFALRDLTFLALLCAFFLVVPCVNVAWALRHRPSEV